MLSDGTNAFSWNARNQAAALNSVSLQYDGFGRRTKNLQNTSFLFDGANTVQELSGSTVLASLLNGGLDEVFTRVDSMGAFTPLKDALAGSGPNFYAYVGDDPINFSDPFGLKRGDLWDQRSYYTDGWTTLRDFGTAAEAFTDAITFGSASKLNDALGANIAVDRCGIGHKLASLSGIVASIPLGGEALPAVIKWLPNGAKGAIGEGLSIAKNALSGSRLIGTHVKAAEAGFSNLTTVFDSVWQSSSGEIYYVESKLGTVRLTAAQGAAAAALGDAYQVEKWTCPFFGGVGNLLGGAGGAAGAMSGRGCGCQ